MDLLLVADRLMVRALPPMKVLRRYLSFKGSFMYNSEFMLVLSCQGLSLFSIASFVKVAGAKLSLRCFVSKLFIFNLFHNISFFSVG